MKPFDFKSSCAVLESFRVLEGLRVFPDSELVSCSWVELVSSGESDGSFGVVEVEPPTPGCFTMPKFLAVISS
jgi:hypothetical protein